MPWLYKQVVREVVMRPKGHGKEKEPNLGQWESWVIYGPFKVHMKILSQVGNGIVRTVLSKDRTVFRKKSRILGGGRRGEDSPFEGPHFVSTKALSSQFSGSNFPPMRKNMGDLKRAVFLTFVLNILLFFLKTILCPWRGLFFLLFRSCL
jgi:hypothetical protein